MQTYADGTERPDVMARLPDWALREMLARHAGPALETARAEQAYREARRAESRERMARTQALFNPAGRSFPEPAERDSDEVDES